MTTYRLTEGATLVLRVDDGPWQTLVFADGDDLTAAAGGLDGITATVDADGLLVLATEDTGETTTLEVDAAASTAAEALGLGTGVAHGRGPGHATLTGSLPGPYALDPAAAMTLHLDGKSRKVTFDEEDHDEWSADDVAARINRQLRRKVARATRDGRVRITSPTQGVGSSLAVAGPDGDVPDAAALLGFTGEAAESDPYRTGPARLICRPPAENAGTVVVENLTAAPIELQLPTGRSVLPARGRLVVTRDTAADGLLRRLIAQGTVRMSPERNS